MSQYKLSQMLLWNDKKQVKEVARLHRSAKKMTSHLDKIMDRKNYTGLREIYLDNEEITLETVVNNRGRKTQLVYENEQEKRFVEWDGHGNYSLSEVNGTCTHIERDRSLGMSHIHIGGITYYDKGREDIEHFDTKEEMQFVIKKLGAAIQVAKTTMDLTMVQNPKSSTKDLVSK